MYEKLQSRVQSHTVGPEKSTGCAGRYVIRWAPAQDGELTAGSRRAHGAGQPAYSVYTLIAQPFHAGLVFAAFPLL